MCFGAAGTAQGFSKQSGGVGGCWNAGSVGWASKRGSVVWVRPGKNNPPACGPRKVVEFGAGRNIRFPVGSIEGSCNRAQPQNTSGNVKKTNFANKAGRDKPRNRHSRFLILELVNEGKTNIRHPWQFFDSIL